MYGIQRNEEHLVLVGDGEAAGCEGQLQNELVSDLRLCLHAHVPGDTLERSNSRFKAMCVHSHCFLGAHSAHSILGKKTRA